MALYLDLVKRLRQECGVSGTGPVTTINQVGELKRLCDWIATAWFDLQSLHPDWKFQRLSTSWTSIDGQAEYTPTQCGITAGTFGRWHPERDNFRVYPTATGTSGEQFLVRIGYGDYRRLWGFGSNRSVKSLPIHISVMPNDSVTLGPKPPAGYTFLGDYYRSPITLSADADVPALPYRHDPIVIVYHAMKMYGVFESGPEVYQFAEKDYERRMTLLRNDQLPQPFFAGGFE